MLCRGRTSEGERPWRIRKYGQELIEEIIRKLESKILIESCHEMTENQTYYVSGLSDALEIIKEQLEDGLKIGEKYFVLMQTDRMSDDIYVDE